MSHGHHREHGPDGHHHEHGVNGHEHGPNGHGHGADGRDHHHEGGAARFLGTAFWVAGVILVAEIAGGLLSHSLALLSDAGHMLTDVLSLALAWYATRLADRPPTARRTYGFHRAGILAALFNAGTLAVVCVGILVEAVSRFAHPVPVTPWIMWLVAGIGLAGNLFIGLRLGADGHAGHGHAHGGHAGHAHAHGANLNVRSAWLHVMGDAAASAGVLVAGVLVLVTHRFWWDPLVSVGISLLIARGAWGIVTQTVNVLMEGAPPGIEAAEVAAAMEADEAVVSVHHVHVWSLDGARAALSGHLVLRDAPLSDSEAVVARVARNLRQRFGIDHATLQLETGPCPYEDCGQSVVRPEVLAEHG